METRLALLYCTPFAILIIRMIKFATDAEKECRKDENENTE